MCNNSCNISVSVKHLITLPNTLVVPHYLLQHVFNTPFYVLDVLQKYSTVFTCTQGHSLISASHRNILRHQPAAISLLHLQLPYPRSLFAWHMFLTRPIYSVPSLNLDPFFASTPPQPHPPSTSSTSLYSLWPKPRLR
jgi:hypothetical protein